MVHHFQQLYHALVKKISVDRSRQDWSSDWNRQHPDPTPEDLLDFWQADHLRNIIPPFSEAPAGFDEVAFLKRLFPLLQVNNIVELGCGYGRLAPAFSPLIYRGLDINPEAIEKARNNWPNYQFEVIEFDTSYPRADLYLAYTVLLHIDDKNIAPIARRLAEACCKLLIVEILDPSFRNARSLVPNFIRSRAEYERVFDSFKLDFELRRPYARYPGKDISYLLLINTANRESG